MDGSPVRSKWRQAYQFSVALCADPLRAQRRRKPAGTLARTGSSRKSRPDRDSRSLRTPRVGAGHGSQPRARHGVVATVARSRKIAGCDREAHDNQKIGISACAPPTLARFITLKKLTLPLLNGSHMPD